jgi:uncharacterized membrane protein YeiH
MPGPADQLADFFTTFGIDHFFELAAIFIAGLAGGISGIKKNMDIFGVLVLAWTTSLFGGVLRDVMIGSLPPVGISNWRFFVSAVGGGLLVYFIYPWIARHKRSIVVLDAFAMALFVWIGTVKGLQFGMTALPSAVVGVLTGVGGGVVRDLFTDNVPLIFSDRQYYAIPASLGAGVTVLLWNLGWRNYTAGLLVVAGIVAFRLVALKLNWVVPAPQPKQR